MGSQEGGAALHGPRSLTLQLNAIVPLWRIFIAGHRVLQQTMLEPVHHQLLEEVRAGQGLDQSFRHLLQAPLGRVAVYSAWCRGILARTPESQIQERQAMQ